jgi:hypothetical protein
VGSSTVYPAVSKSLTTEPVRDFLLVKLSVRPSVSCKHDDDDYYNSIDILVAKLTSANKIDSQVYKWITGGLQRRFISEQEFMDGLYKIYEKHNQHSLKQHIPLDIYQYYSKFMKHDAS